MSTNPPALALASASTEASNRYPIRTVATLTGVNAITLRAWERRYGLLTPHRTPSGHRLYSQADIARIHEVVALLDQGISIGQAKDVLAARDAKAEVEDAPRPDQAVWTGYQQRLLHAIARFDESELDAVYNEALSLYPVDVVTRRLIVPLLVTLGRRWETLAGGIAEEHFFSVFLRNKLGARFHHRAQRSGGKTVLAACLPGEHHEIGLLLFALAAQARGLRLIVLGANMPLAELASAAQRASCDAIVLAGALPEPAAGFEQDLKQLTASIPMPVFIGGTTSVAQHDAISRAGVMPLGEDMTLAIRRVQSVLDQP